MILISHFLTEEIMSSNLHREYYRILEDISELDREGLNAIIYNQSKEIASILVDGNFSNLNGGGILPWEIEILATFFIMSQKSFKKKGRYKVTSYTGKQILTRILRVISENHKITKALSRKTYFSKLYLEKAMNQQFEIQSHLNFEHVFWI